MNEREDKKINQLHFHYLQRKKTKKEWQIVVTHK